MDRKQEYNQLIKDLQAVPPQADHTVQHARIRAKKARRKGVCGVLSGIAACLVAFVLAVNLFPPFASAMGRLPVLGDLARFVALSPSLKAAVDNEYVQPVGIRQEQNGIVVTIEYLIVDQKQVNVFFSVSGDQKPSDAYCTAWLPSQPEGYLLTGPGMPVSKDLLYKTTLDFIDQDVPGEISICLGVYASDPAPLLWEDEDLWVMPQRGQTECLAKFTFDLTFDPLFTETGERIPVGQWIKFGGQRLYVEAVELYPSQLRLCLADDPDNTAWLQALEFEAVDQDGNMVERIQSGILATGDSITPFMSQHRLESNYFTSSGPFTIRILSARWREKDLPDCTVYLEEGRAEHLPGDIVFDSAVRTNDGWELLFHSSFLVHPGTVMEVTCGFLGNCYDEKGNGYIISQAVMMDTQGNQTLRLRVSGFQGDVMRIETYESFSTTPMDPLLIEIVR